MNQLNAKQSNLCKFTFCKLKSEKDYEEYCILHSNSPNKDVSKFNKEFEKFLLTNQSENQSDIYINNFIFPVHFNYFNVPFNKKTVIFNKCDFFDSLNLNDQKLFFRIIFENCNFKNNLIFKKGYYDKAIFLIKCNFSNSIVIKQSIFNAFIIQNSNINEDLYIQNSHFHYVFHISKNIFNKNSFFILMNTDIDHTKNALINDTNLYNLYLNNVKINNIDFINTTFKNENGRNIIANENWTIKIEENYEEKGIFYKKIHSKLLDDFTESAYAQIAKSFDRNGFYRESGLFYISQMEMRRKRKSNWVTRNLFSPEAFYRIFSNYGENITKPLLWILATLILSPLLIIWILNKFSIRILVQISYLEIVKYMKINLMQMLYPGAKVEISNLLFYIFCGFERLFLISLVAFFLLALKRRFRKA